MHCLKNNLNLGFKKNGTAGAHVYFRFLSLMYDNIRRTYKQTVQDDTSSVFFYQITFGWPSAQSNTTEFITELGKHLGREISLHISPTGPGLRASADETGCEAKQMTVRILQSWLKKKETCKE